MPDVLEVGAVSGWKLLIADPSAIKRYVKVVQDPHSGEAWLEHSHDGFLSPWTRVEPELYTLETGGARVPPGWQWPHRMHEQPVDPIREREATRLAELHGLVAEGSTMRLDLERAARTRGLPSEQLRGRSPLLDALKAYQELELLAARTSLAMRKRYRPPAPPYKIRRIFVKGWPARASKEKDTWGSPGHGWEAALETFTRTDLLSRIIGWIARHAPAPRMSKVHVSDEVLEASTAYSRELMRESEIDIDSYLSEPD